MYRKNISAVNIPVIAVFWQQISCRFPLLSNETESDILKNRGKAEVPEQILQRSLCFSCLYKQSDKQKEEITL